MCWHLERAKIYLKNYIASNMKLLKAFLIFIIVFGIMYFFTGFILADFNFANWSDTNRGFIIFISFFVAFSGYIWDTTPAS